MATSRSRQTLNNPIVSLENFETREPDEHYDPGELPEDPAALNAEFALSSALQQLGEDESNNAKLIVHRMVTENGKQIEEWLKETTPAEFATEGVGGIAREFGGGMYRVRVFVRGQKGFLTQKVIRIAAQKEPPASAPLAGLSDLANAMREGFNGLAQIIAAQAQANTPKPESRADMLKEMMLFKELFAPAQMPQQDGGMGALHMAKELLQLTRDLAPPINSDGEVDPMTVIWKALEMFGKPLADSVRGGQAAGVPQLPAPPVASVNPAVQTVAQPEGEDMNFFVKQIVRQLIGKAKAGESPAAIGNMVIDQAPQKLIDEMLDDPQWFGKLLAIEPEVETVRTWFHEMRDHIARELTDIDDSVIKDGKPIPVDHDSKSAS